jgi:N4-gp56 family major capsid protein
MTTYLQNETFYGDNPWGAIATKERDIYVPDLLDTFRGFSVYRPLVPYEVNLAAARTGQMFFTELYDLEPNTDPLETRQVWVKAMVSDSRQLVVTMEHHGGKVVLHEFDDLITYWQENGVAGLKNIIRRQLGRAISDHLDILARNAFAAGYHVRYPNGKANFGELTETDLFDPKEVKKIRLRLELDEVPGHNDPVVGTPSTILAVTSPSVIYDISEDEEWTEVLEKANAAALMTGEVGNMYGTRFLKTRRNILWNCGPITKQALLKVNVSAGDGAAQTVNNYTVGQESGVTRYVTVDDVGEGGDGASFEVGDILTLHKTRTDDYGVTNGVDFNEGTARTRKVVSIDRDNKRVSFDKPLFDEFTADAAWLTKALHVHMSVFVGGARGVVAGVGQPPTVLEPKPFDDLEAFYRCAWKSRIKFQQHRSEVLEVYFTAGSVNP